MKIEIPSIIKKQIIALTGFLLSGFVAAHLLGNIMIFFGPEAYNSYAKKLMSLGPILYLMEAGLVVIFLIHMGFTLALIIENKKARSIAYKKSPSTKKRSIASRIMPYTGTLIFAFVVLHLLDFKYNNHYGMVAGKLQEGLYARVYESFTDPLHSFLYIIAICAVSFHLAHAIQSMFQTFGLSSTKSHPYLVKLSVTIGVLIALIFGSLPIFVMAKEKAAQKPKVSFYDTSKEVMHNET
jgi:succinate dehydrogenase / fumarate reductase cytochrome b subunit